MTANVRGNFRFAFFLRKSIQLKGYSVGLRRPRMESSGDGKLGTAATVSSDSVGGPAVVEAASTQKVALPPTEAPLALEENDDSAALQTEGGAPAAQADADVKASRAAAVRARTRDFRTDNQRVY